MAESFSSSWEANCAANEQTNGIDFKDGSQLSKLSVKKTRKLAKANIRDLSGPKNAVGLPPQFEPTLPRVNGSEGVIKSYILPDKKTGVVRGVGMSRSCRPHH